MLTKPPVLVSHTKVSNHTKLSNLYLLIPFLYQNTSNMPSELEIRYQQALATISDQNEPNITELARSFSLPYRSLLRRFHARGKVKTKISPQRALNMMQEAALIRYIKQLDDLWAPCTLQEIKRCANLILARSNQPPVSKIWSSRFVRRLPEGFFWIKQKPMDKNRLESEDILRLMTWFNYVGD
jgi:hypothetical protein